MHNDVRLLRDTAGLSQGQLATAMGVSRQTINSSALFLFGGRSETLAGLGGPGRDERWVAIDMRATAASGLVVITVLIAAFLWEVGHGRDGSPYGQLCALAGVVYITAVAIQRWRG